MRCRRRGRGGRVEEGSGGGGGGGEWKRKEYCAALIQVSSAASWLSKRAFFAIRIFFFPHPRFVFGITRPKTFAANNNNNNNKAVHVYGTYFDPWRRRWAAKQEPVRLYAQRVFYFSKCLVQSTPKVIGKRTRRNLVGSFGNIQLVRAFEYSLCLTVDSVRFRLWKVNL